MSRFHVRMYGLEGCEACEILNGLLTNILKEPVFSEIHYSKHLFTIDLKPDEYGILPQSFPTLVAFVDNKLSFGWEGLAVGLSESERSELIKAELSKLLLV